LTTYERLTAQRQVRPRRPVTPRPATSAQDVIDPARLVGPDVVRALALIGVVLMNYHGYLINAGGERADNFWGRFFDPWEGPLGTRFAATFVLTAGVGVTLLTRRATANREFDPAGVSAKRWTLMRRGLLLYGFGVVFYEIWPGSILPYYGAMFFIAAFLFTLATPWIAAIGAGAALIGAGIEWWVVERGMDGHSTTWLNNPPPGGGMWSNSPRGLLFNLFVNHTHPLFPWLAFFCAGIIVGRLLTTQWWKPVVLSLGLTLFGFATILSDSLGGSDDTPLAQHLASNDAFDRGLLYTASALGTSLAAFTIIYTVASRFARAPVTQLFAHAGQMSLTLYVLHTLVFNYIVNWKGWIEPAGLDLALTFTLCYWILAIAAGWAWHRRFGIGPIEWLYRKLSA
jgi:uncharacterized protein